MGVNFLTEGDWEWGGSTASSRPPPPVERATAGGFEWGGATGEVFSPGPCPGVSTGCCGPENPIAENLVARLRPDGGTGGCGCNDGALLPLTHDNAAPGCPPDSDCWSGPFPGDCGCGGSLMVYCNNGAWFWQTVGAGWDGGDITGQSFDTADCGPPLHLVSVHVFKVCSGCNMEFYFSVSPS